MYSIWKTEFLLPLVESSIAQSYYFFLFLSFFYKFIDCEAQGYMEAVFTNWGSSLHEHTQFALNEFLSNRGWNSTDDLRTSFYNQIRSKKILVDAMLEYISDLKILMEVTVVGFIILFLLRKFGGIYIQPWFV